MIIYVCSNCKEEHLLNVICYSPKPKEIHIILTDNTTEQIEQETIVKEYCPECVSNNIIRKGFLHTKCLVCGWKGLSGEVLVKRGNK